MQDQNTVLQVNNLTMQYRLTTEKVESFKEFFIKKLMKKINYEHFLALDNVSFEVKKGEIFGIVGLNGAGKSTLLKIIAGILKPTFGEVTRRGSIAPLIELGAGFNNDLSGIENIYLNGMLLGFSKKFLSNKIDEIIAFSELEKFIHSPIKNYSSGMKARLGFSIATSIQPNLLIVDEVLSVGDFKFKEKCEQKIKNMIQSGTSVLFVSHSLSQVQELCQTVLWLEKGKVREIGESAIVCNKFREEA
ncbi:ABC transporter ATP-binding protein [Paenibacillus humicola]|uniref:ABC transporter ATP-binding protein n=1 Tax=Paenibacillus humicola TaxID=3110540 RepID=UPI00237C1580|nr:ABC transporter ATP-binding protein [Paenibacillus humicola]